jgi:hypothetical protein
MKIAWRAAPMILGSTDVRKPTRSAEISAAGQAIRGSHKLKSGTRLHQTRPTDRLSTTQRQQLHSPPVSTITPHQLCDLLE